jgi:hypothetical protein
MYFSASASGWAGWALAHLEFGSSVNPITTRGADYAQHITAGPPRFENLAASLYFQELAFLQNKQKRFGGSWFKIINLLTPLSCFANLSHNNASNFQTKLF